MHRHLLHALIVCALGCCALRAQTSTDLNEGMRVTPDSANDAFSLSWWGVDDRTYFIKQSENLSLWNYVPVIEPGGEEVISWGFDQRGQAVLPPPAHRPGKTVIPGGTILTMTGFPTRGSPAEHRSVLRYRRKRQRHSRRLRDVSNQRHRPGRTRRLPRRPAWTQPQGSGPPGCGIESPAHGQLKRAEEHRRDATHP